MKRQLIKWLSPGLRQRSTANGFTLTELLVGIALSGITLTLAGVGIISIMQAQQKSAVEVSQRLNLNRALDFMADELRMAKSVSAAANPTVSCGTATGVLNLTLPDNSQVVYYIQNFGSCPRNPWSGPAAIYRKKGTETAQLLVDATTAPATLPTCPTGITRVGESGFYACISSNNRTADLYLYGKLTNAYGNNNGTYLVNSQVSARSFP